MSKLIDLLREHRGRRSGADELVSICDGLPPCTPATLKQVLREIDGTTRGLPQGETVDNEEGKT